MDRNKLIFKYLFSINLNLVINKNINIEYCNNVLLYNKKKIDINLKYKNSVTIEYDKIYKLFKNNILIY